MNSIDLLYIASALLLTTLYLIQKAKKRIKIQNECDHNSHNYKVLGQRETYTEDGLYRIVIERRKCKCGKVYYATVDVEVF